MRITWIAIATIVLLTSICLAGACKSDSGDDDDDDDDGGYPIGDVDVSWFTCSLYDGLNDGRAECSSTKMPLHWRADEDEVFSSYAKRLLSQSDESEGQLWLLHGGPGASGVIDLAGYMEYIQDRYPELDLYTIDPRGTGYSEYVGCPDQEAPSSEGGEYITANEMDDCIAWLEDEYGDKLGVFNVTYSALDLAAYINATREEGKKVLIWGGSGGTIWSQRFLQLFPDMADGIVLEGICPPNESLVFQDEYDDVVGRKILEMCAQDNFCSSKLPDPLNTLVDLLDKLDSGHCSEVGIDRDLAIEFINYLAYYHPYHTAIPALIYRLYRCDPEDMEAIVHFYNALFGGKGSKSIQHEGQSFSYVLFYNEVCSELWEYEDFADNGELLAYLDSVYESAVLGSGKGYDRNDVYLKWNKYTDELDNTWAESDVPMLMLQGMIDPSTPYDFAKEVGAHFDGEHQHFAAFPYAPHNVSNGTPLSRDTNPEYCGEQLFIEFLRDPTGDLDTSCIEQALPLDFEGKAYGNYFFGTPDYWENPEEKSCGAAGPDELPQDFRHIQRDLRRRLGEIR